jgi:hypothetical protein
MNRWLVAGALFAAVGGQERRFSLGFVTFGLGRRNVLSLLVDGL